MSIWVNSIVSVTLISLLSLIGLATFSLEEEKLKSALIYLVSFSAGALLGDAFIHLIPEGMQVNEGELQTSLLILLGIIVSFSMETFLQWRHCHIPTSHDHPHPFAYMGLFGDAVHNFIDGLIIGSSYLTSTSLGVATTIAIVFHEIPQEIGDFGVLIYGGFSKFKAVVFNFVTALMAILGTIVVLSLDVYIRGVVPLLIPFAAGNFIYIAGSDLIPELHKEALDLFKAALQLLAFVFGILVLLVLVTLG